MGNSVIRSAQRHYKEALVRVNAAAIYALSPQDVRSAVELLTKCAAQNGGFSYLPHGTPVQSAPLVATYFILQCALQYCFWSVVNGEFVRYAHNGRIGADALSTAFHDEFVSVLADGGVLNAPYAVQLSALRKGFCQGPTLEGVTAVFGDIPMAEERRAHLSAILSRPEQLERCGAQLVWNVLKQQVTVDDASLLAELFPEAYSDEFLKKAQLALICISHTLGMASKFLDITAPADYQLPRVLRRLGIIEYSADLARAVDAGEIIPRGDPRENAIRAATTLAVQVLHEHTQCTKAELDAWLWGQRNDCTGDLFHRTPTTDY